MLFQAVSHPWSESIISSVIHSDGKPVFINWPELSKAAETKIAKRLYAVVIRVATKAETDDRKSGKGIEVGKGLHPTGIV